jgi:hypothetical protein
MEELRKQGFHSGNWRDETTGEDFGLKDAIETVSADEMAAKVIRVARTLQQECDGRTVATLWLREDRDLLLPDDEFEMIHIRATNVGYALQQYSAWKQSKRH